MFLSSRFLALIFAYVSGKSCPCIIIWYPPAPYFHLRTSSCSCALLHNYLFHRQNQGTAILPFVYFFSQMLVCFPFSDGSISSILLEMQMRKWKAWEDETKTLEYQYHNGKCLVHSFA